MIERVRREERGGGERGDFAIFIAVIMVALLLLGGIAYDGPRLIATRQHAAHTAAEAARVAAATIAAGGTPAQARTASETRLSKEPLRYGEPIGLVSFGCAANRVEVVVGTAYRARSALAVLRDSHPVTARGAAETVLVGPDGAPALDAHLPECPLRADAP